MEVRDIGDTCVDVDKILLLVVVDLSIDILSKLIQKKDIVAINVSRKY